MQNIDIFTAAVSCLTGGLFIHFFGVRRTRVRTLEKALQESCLKYAMAIEQGRKELEEYRGERLVLKGIINADTERAERLMEKVEALQGEKTRLFKVLLSHRIALNKIKDLADKQIGVSCDCNGDRYVYFFKFLANDELANEGAN